MFTAADGADKNVSVEAFRMKGLLELYAIHRIMVYILSPN
jgi:hypothetical protein